MDHGRCVDYRSGMDWGSRRSSLRVGGRVVHNCVETVKQMQREKCREKIKETVGDKDTQNKDLSCTATFAIQ